MSKLVEMRNVEKEIQELTARLESLKGDERVKKELEFEDKLHDLMKEYGKTNRDVLAILDPEGRAAVTNTTSSATKRTRKMKQYKNPHTGETIETKGGNHKVLKAWKEQYGSDVVEGWASILG
ncbi:MAG: histone-like nucleoid-structuring protein, MvaT/MvaU family [Halopseudomonas yangmingensis]|uniref:H-NS histone family protein n=1 Tax=Halopseudomonas yangmingensis TaxID=1720063 RepID=A0A1I4SC23_9GAMM|nr:histone-like nucleoid-structuring protein, MvaT/MvaU family [Halopseudomonas yangmingensis]SFM61870.1 H-NS histone family protein [Halopseudomonas yangmingensis]